MVQGGDPTGTGRGGSSIYGYGMQGCVRVNTVWWCRDKFEDEIRDDLKHTGAGILSMANRLVMLQPKCLLVCICSFILQWTKH